MRRPFDVTAEVNNNLKELLDTLVELNARKFHAEADGWTVKFVVCEGDVDVTISRDQWPTLDEVAE